MEMTISLPTIGAVEQASDINIYIIDLANTPIFGSSLNIWDIPLYNSADRGKDNYFQSFDDVDEHLCNY